MPVTLISTAVTLMVSGGGIWVYFLTALLKYNLRAIQFPHLSCIIQRFLVQAQAC